MRTPQGCGVPREARGPAGASASRGGECTRGRGGLMRRGSLAGRGSSEGCGVLTAGGGLPGRVWQRSLATEGGSRGRLAVNDRAASRASSCGNCALSGWPGCGGRRPRLAADLPAEPAGRVTCGTARRGAGPLGAHWSAPAGPISGDGWPSCRLADWRAAGLVNVPRPVTVWRLRPTSANRGRPGAGPVPSIGARPRLRQSGPTGGLSRGRVTGGAGKLKPGSINWLMAA